MALQRSGLYRDPPKISPHTRQKTQSPAGVTWFVSSPPGQQLVSKMGLLCKEADDAVTRMLPLPLSSFFAVSIWLLKTAEMFNIDNPLKPLFY